MRRMMHAITVPLLFSSISVAQDIPGPGVHATPAPVVAPSAESTAMTAPTEFYPTTSGQPYSALTSYMMCHDNCKDFWAGYSAERAAKASKLCKECNHRHCHGHQGCGTGSCNAGCGVGVSGECDSQSCGTTIHGNHVANRYQQSWSTLYAASDATRGSSPVAKVSMASSGRRDPNATSGTNSLLVPTQSNAQMRGSNPAEGWAASPSPSGQQVGQPVISPYLKTRNASQDSLSRNVWRQGDLQKDGPMYKQATMPPASGSWAR